MSTFYNRATLTYGGNVIDSNTVRGELTRALTMELRAVSDVYRPGEAVAYAATLTNTGTTETAPLTFRDDLGAGDPAAGIPAPLDFVPGSLKFYVNGAPQEAPAAVPGAGLTLRDIRVPARGDATLLYAARANEYAPLGPGAMIASTARLDDAASAQPGGGNAQFPLTAATQVRPDARPRLALHKRLTPASVSAGEELTYTLTIENSGATPVAATDGITVSDRFDPLLEITSVRYNGEAWSAPVNYSYDGNTGLFATAANQIAVDAASFTRDAATGRWQVTPGASTIEITGRLR